MNIEMTDSCTVAASLTAGFKRSASLLQHRIEANSLALEQAQNALHPDYVVKAVREVILIVLDLRLLIAACESQAAAVGIKTSPEIRQQINATMSYVVQQSEGAMARILPPWMATVRKGWPKVYRSATKKMVLPAWLKADSGRKSFLSLLLTSAALPCGLLPP